MTHWMDEEAERLWHEAPPVRSGMGPSLRVFLYLAAICLLAIYGAARLALDIAAWLTS